MYGMLHAQVPFFSEEAASMVNQQPEVMFAIYRKVSIAKINLENIIAVSVVYNSLPVQSITFRCNDHFFAVIHYVRLHNVDRLSNIVLERIS